MSEQEKNITAAATDADQPAKKASKKAGKKSAAKKAAGKTASSKTAVKKSAGNKAAVKKAVAKTSVDKSTSADNSKAADKSGGKITGKSLSVTLTRSPNGCIARHRATVRGLGLRRMHHTVHLEDTSAIRGMLRQVAYLVRVEQL